MERKEHKHTIVYESCIIGDDEIKKLIGLKEDENIKSMEVSKPSCEKGYWSIEIKTEKIAIEFIHTKN